jgi:hypothetical protein
VWACAAAPDDVDVGIPVSNADSRKLRAHYGISIDLGANNEEEERDRKILSSRGVLCAMQMTSFEDIEVSTVDVPAIMTIAESERSAV